MSTGERTPSLPNWDSVLETYLRAAELNGKDAFTTRQLSSTKLGTNVSAPALDAEATSLYNLLRMAAMYGLVEWYGGDEFAARVLPEGEEDEWHDAYYTRAKLLREAVQRLVSEQKKLKEFVKKKIEAIEHKNRTYLTAYVGSTTDAAGINAFVYNAWDPQKHAGVVLRSRGRNISVAKGVAQELCAGASETFSYDQVEEEIYRNEQGLSGDIFLEIKIESSPRAPS